MNIVCIQPFLDDVVFCVLAESCKKAPSNLQARKIHVYKQRDLIELSQLCIDMHLISEIPSPPY